MSTQEVPQWRRRGDVMILRNRINVLQQDLVELQASDAPDIAQINELEARIEREQLQLTTLESGESQIVPPQTYTWPPVGTNPGLPAGTNPDPTGVTSDNAAGVPNIEDLPGGSEEVVPPNQNQTGDVEMVGNEERDSEEPPVELTQVQRAIQTLQNLNENTENPQQVRDLMTSLETSNLNTNIPTPTIINKELKEYQKQGFNWIVGKENDPNRMGGLLADEMGLGKTIQAISTILAHGSTNWNCATTLVVVPKSLFNQWKCEILTDVQLWRRFGPLQQKFSFRRFYRESARPTFLTLGAYSVVLTTYGTVADQLKRREIWEQKLRDHPDAGPTGNEDYYPLIGSSEGNDSKWYRVILDESHTIKNRQSKNFKACMALKAKYRWCLSGTPMMNTLNELQPQIEFLRIAPYNDGAVFGNAFTKPINGQNEYNRRTAVRKLQVFLHSMSLRRTRESRINGQLILEMPEMTTLNHTLNFSPDELNFYSAIETQSELIYNKYLADRAVGRVYLHVFERLLRLRQAAIHPLLIKKHAQQGVRAPPRSTNDSLDPAEICRQLDDTVVQRIKAKDDFFCPVHQEEITDPLFFFACGHELCSECPELFGQLWPGTTLPNCFYCRDRIDLEKTFTWAAFKQVHMPEVVEDDAAGVEPEILDDRFERWHTESGQVLLSAKTKKTARLLLDIRTRGEGEKSLVFCSFTGFFDHLKYVLDAHGIKHLRLDGSMSIEQRKEAAETLASDDSIEAMLVSTRAGNMGLNLTAANHVIIIDPQWNPLVEAQAIRRVYRIGQLKAVFVHRLYARGTVDERIKAVQEKKLQAVQNVMGDIAPDLFQRPSEEELMQLFGLHETAEHDDGNEARVNWIGN